jgi:uncharacterized membrane protein
MSPQGSSEHHHYQLVLFGFAGAGRAAEVARELDGTQQLAGAGVVAQAIVERDAQGAVHVHERGRGGVAGVAGAVTGGLLGLMLGPLGVILLAAVGGALGGLMGRYAGAAVPEDDLRRLANALPPDSSGLALLAERTAAERLVAGLDRYHANVITVNVGDDLADEIDAAVAAATRPPASRTR